MLSKIPKEQEETSRIRFYNPANEDDEEELRNWCRIHWGRTLSKDIEFFNVPSYHDCCLCFSRKWYSKKNSHPPLQSASILKILALKKAKSHEDFFKWLKERIREHQRLGRKPFFPTINVPHLEQDCEDEQAANCQCSEALRKRLFDLTEKHESAEKRLKQLTEDNQKLLASSKSWCLKYQDLLDSKEEEKADFSDFTPKKAVKTEDTNLNLLLL